MRAFAIVILLAGTAQAQELIDLHQRTDGMQVETYDRDPYSGIFNWAGVNCCNGEDCRKIVDPKDIEPIAGGYRVRPTGEIVDRETRLGDESPERGRATQATHTPLGEAHREHRKRLIAA